MTLDERLEFRARLARARADWLRIEERAVDAGDDELDSRMAIARLAMLDAIDRVDQLLGIYDLDEAVA